MTSISNAVTDFVASLRELPFTRQTSLDDVLQPALTMEADLRRLFATSPEHPFLDNMHVGLVDIFTLDSRIRHSRERLWEKGLDKEYIMPLSPDLRRRHGTPCTVPDLDTFKHNFDLFTHGILPDLNKWRNVIVAGGSVMACLIPTFPPFSPQQLNKTYQTTYRCSDIDLFLFGLSAEEAKKAIADVYHSICRQSTFPVTCVRKANVVSFHTTYPARPIQVVLRLYRSPAEILAGFDIDSACFAYDGKRVWTNPRGLVSLIRQSNTIDLSRRSPSYEIRLTKYASRGFEIYYPALRREELAIHLFHPSLDKFPNGLARLIVLEKLSSDRHAYTHLKYPGAPRSRAETRLPNMDYDIDTNDYELVWTQVPYGTSWDAKAIRKLIKKIDKKMNRTDVLEEAGRRLHRHAVYAGTLGECIKFHCKNCPAPASDDDLKLIQSEGHKYFRGPLRFIETNPGQQLLTGSFVPLTEGDWEAEAYGIGSAHSDDDNDSGNAWEDEMPRFSAGRYRV